MDAIIPFLRGLFPEAGHDKIWLVGGIVRDYLDHKSGRDIDLVTTLSPDSLKASGFRLVAAKSAAQIHFLYHPEFGKIEAVTIDAPDCIVEDLERRDFTVNAMAMALGGGIIDPLGGMDDLGARRLRTCTDRSFTDDPIRLFRGLRFETEGWRLASEAEQLITGVDWDARCVGIPVERFSTEMLKALAGPDPVRFFQRMLSLQVGKSFLPELFCMPRVPAGPPEHHPEGSLFSHTMQALERMAAMTGDPTARFSALFHDLGKLATSPGEWPKHHGHEETGFAMAPQLCNRLRLPAAMRTALAWSCRLHGVVNRWGELRDSTRIEVAEKALKSRTDRLLPLLAAADKPGTTLDGWEEALRCAALNASDLGIEHSLLEARPPLERHVLLLQRRVERLRSERRR